MRLRHGTLILAAVASLGLGACNRSDTQPGARATASGSSGGAVTGATGSGAAGTSSMGGPGVGLAGGLGPSGSASQPTGVAEGSANRTPRSSVGNR
jgi:hypothetical protein